MQTQSTTWVDINTLTERYGIRIKHRIKGWINAGDDKGMFMFETTKERDGKRAELRKETPDWAAKS